MKNIFIIFAVIMAFCFGTATIVLRGGLEERTATATNSSREISSAPRRIAIRVAPAARCGISTTAFPLDSIMNAFGMLAPRRVGQSSEASKQPDNEA